MVALRLRWDFLVKAENEAEAGAEVELTAAPSDGGIAVVTACCC